MVLLKCHRYSLAAQKMFLMNFYSDITEMENYQQLARKSIGHPVKLIPHVQLKHELIKHGYATYNRLVKHRFVGQKGT